MAASKHPKHICESVHGILAALIANVKHVHPLTEEAADKLVHDAFTIAYSLHKEIGDTPAK